MRRVYSCFGFSLIALAACSSGGDAAGEDDDLTSLTARQRKLAFEGVVYVPTNAGDKAILEAAHKQTQSAFGALLANEIAVQSRELENLKPESLRKREVIVVDTNAPGDTGQRMLEVTYRYRDNAVVPIAMARKTAISLAVLGQAAEEATAKIVELCTKNDKEAHEDAENGLLWYDFNPNKASCRRAMEQEQRAIDADTAKLADPETMVTVSRTKRLFVPATMSLARADNADHATYPEYDRLFAGGATPGVLTLAIVTGRLEHDHVEAIKDDGYFHWMDMLGVIFQAHPQFQLKSIEPKVDVSSATIAGKTYEGLSFKDFIQWTVYEQGWPAGLPASSRTALATEIANRLDGKWVTFEKPVSVVIGDAAPRDLTIRIETLFGADEDEAPHRRALNRGDVVIYNGHSYIGYGPLDPGNFRATTFPKSYQLFWFDSCVSYNYYEKDYFALKQGGSENLDVITNALEAPSYRSGEAQGKLVARLLDGSSPSYQTLLTEAKATDSLRVVDGEIDNRFNPQRTRIRVTPK